MLILADATQIPMTDESVQCVVTSPPYWGLRDYGVAGQLGLERTPEEYVANMLTVFREVRRVLRRDGTVWLNLGDSYNGGNKGNSGAIRPGDKQGTNIGSWSTRRRDTGTLSPTRSGGAVDLKVKDLCGIPWRVALALQADGWWLRSDIIWSKPNPMPESVTDRPTRSHEYLFLLAKSERYYFDQEAVREPASRNSHARAASNRGNKEVSWSKGWDMSTGNGGHGNFHRLGREGVNSRMHLDRDPRYTSDRKVRQPGVTPKSAVPGSGVKANESFHAACVDLVETRNIRSVWTIATQPYSEAHFATFPEDLVKPCIVAGTSHKGCCPDCGAPWERIVENSYEYKTLGWEPGCKCGIKESQACIVLDPFAGSGTVVKVAKDLGRIGVGLDLKPEYLAMAKRRTAQQGFGNLLRETP